MNYDCSNEEDVLKLRKAVEKIIADGDSVKLVRKSKHPRTIRQNRYLYLLLNYFAACYGCSMDYAKRVFYKTLVNKDLYVIKRTNKKGDEFFDLRSSASLTRPEMTLSIDRFKIWSSMEAGILLPERDQAEFIAHCENQIELNKEFL